MYHSVPLLSDGYGYPTCPHVPVLSYFWKPIEFQRSTGTRIPWHNPILHISGLSFGDADLHKVNEHSLTRPPPFHRTRDLQTICASIDCPVA